MSKVTNKAVIFDMDGVLVNTGEFHKQSWYDLADKEGFEMSDDFFYSTFGMQNYQIIPMLAKREMTRAEIDKLAEWKEKRYRQLIKGKLHLLDGAGQLIADLKKAGFLLAVGTSTPRENLEFMLEHTHVHDFFDAFVTGEDVENGKPAPDTFLKAAEKLSVVPHNCVVVEDAVQGVQAGKSAGMKVIAVTTTRKRKELLLADIIVDHLSELEVKTFVKLVS